MNTQKNFTRRTDKLRATLQADPLLILQSDLPLSQAVRSVSISDLIGMVNTGLDDFNSAKDGACLSILMAARFMAVMSILNMMRDKRYRESIGTLKTNRTLYQNLKEDLGDILYIYRKLKTNPNGLNWPIINAYDQQYRDAHLQHQFEEMDIQLSKKPRFSFALLIKNRGKSA